MRVEKQLEAKDLVGKIISVAYDINETTDLEVSVEVNKGGLAVLVADGTTLAGDIFLTYETSGFDTSTLFTIWEILNSCQNYSKEIIKYDQELEKQDELTLAHLVNKDKFDAFCENLKGYKKYTKELCKEYLLTKKLLEGVNG